MRFDGPRIGEIEMNLTKQDYYLEAKRLKEAAERLKQVRVNITRIKNNFRPNQSNEELYELFSQKKYLDAQLNEMIFNDLLLVGKRKAVGYLPLLSIQEYGRTIDEFMAFAVEHGLKFKIFLDCTVKGGSLYLYDEYWLKQLLIENAATLIKADIPLHPEAYIDYIAHYSVVDEEAFVIVGKTFNDPRFR